MGVVASNFQGSDGGIVADVVEPSSDQWISKHAEVCKMPVSQVKELWSNFQKLGCSRDGELSVATISSLPTGVPSTEGAFMDKMIKQFPKTEQGGLSFQTYCNATKWFSDASTDTRIRGAFRVLNNGNNLTEAILTEILSEIYAETSGAVINRTAQVFLREVDVKGQGSIDEDDFVSWVQKMPADVIEEIMQFDAPTSQTPVQKHDSDPSRPSIALLRRVADNAKNSDWLLLVNKLGFTEEEIKEVGDLLGNKKHDQHLFELLKMWRNKTDTEVTMETLKDALVLSGMEEAAAVLQS